MFIHLTLQEGGAAITLNPLHVVSFKADEDGDGTSIVCAFVGGTDVLRYEVSESLDYVRYLLNRTIEEYFEDENSPLNERDDETLRDEYGGGPYS